MSSSVEKRKIYNHDNVHTHTTYEQQRTENSLMKFFYSYRQNQRQFFKTIKLLREEHVPYLLKGLDSLSSAYECLDASRPWLCYWILHSLDLLNALPKDEKLYKRIISFLSKCQNPTGGYGGGPGQFSHLAPTYAAILSLMILGTKEAYESINKKTLLQFLLSLKTKEGGFRMHKDGEVDLRGCYTALCVAQLLNILTPELCEKVDEYILSCQTYEGGISAYPGNEAHGGYAFCGIAALMILKKAHLLDTNAFSNWCVRRQMSFEGGFQGRTHKLVDSCYSFWMGGCFPLLRGLLSSQKEYYTEEDLAIFDYLQWTPPENKPIKQNVKISKKNYDHETLIDIDEGSCNIVEIDDEGNVINEYPELEEGDWFFDNTALQEYLLLCCQIEEGGMRDKPGKSRDYYHTCYALSGLSIAQHHLNGRKTILGDPENELRVISPIFNICRDKATKALLYFTKKNVI